MGATADADAMAIMTPNLNYMEISTMRATLSQLWLTLTTLLEGITAFSSAFRELGIWAHQEAVTARSEADEERADRLAERRAARLANQQQPQAPASN